MCERRIFDRSISLWTNPICEACKKATNQELDGPVSIWQVGQEYDNDRYRLMFVGKNARGAIHNNASDQLAEQGIIDGTGEADEWIGQKWSAYWYYTAAIIEHLFGSLETGWERVAFTNLVKCNNSMNIDTTNNETATYCLDKLGVTWKEFEILQPLNIILLTGRNYDDFIDRYTKRFECHEKHDRNYQVVNGNKKMLWWERHCVDQKNGRNFRLLRTSHPERQKKLSFVQQLAQWVADEAIE
jgi:hypothetical protein